jgi:hypothetical protein
MPYYSGMKIFVVSKHTECCHFEAQGAFSSLEIAMSSIKAALIDGYGITNITSEDGTTIVTVENVHTRKYIIQGFDLETPIPKLDY